MATRGRRAGDSGETRRAIVDAARGSFAEVGFERSTLRAIADRAGVDPALIHHYFGSKEGLLAAVITPPFDPAVVLDGAGGGKEPLGHDVVRRILTVWTGQPDVIAQMVALARTAVTSEHAALALRDQFLRTFAPVIATLAARDQADLRIALCMSQIGGLFMARHIAAVPALTSASIDQLVGAVGPTMHRYLTGDLTPATSGRRSARG